MNLERIQRCKPLPHPPEFYRERAEYCERVARQQRNRQMRAQFKGAALQWRAWEEEAKEQRA